MLFPVAEPSRPPKVMIGVRQAKYRKKMEAIDWRTKASLKSDQYQGALRLMSFFRPPNHLKILKKKRKKVSV